MMKYSRRCSFVHEKQLPPQSCPSEHFLKEEVGEVEEGEEEEEEGGP